MDGVRPANRSCARLGQAEMLYLASFHKVSDRSGHVFDWHGRIDAVLVEKVDAICAEPL
jgi:hypothetical protein